MRKLFSVIVAAALVLSLIAIPSMAAEDVEVDLSNVDIAKAEFGPHGYDGEFCIMYDYGLIADLGSYNLADYSKIEITYATDLSYEAKKSDMTQTACFAIMSEKVPIGQATDPEYTNADKIIGKADCTDGEILNEDGENWDKGERTAVIDLQGSTHNGNIYLVHFNSTQNQALVVGVKLIAKTAGNNPVDDDKDKDDNKDDNKTDNPKAGDASVTALVASAVVVAMMLAGTVYKKNETN